MIGGKRRKDKKVREKENLLKSETERERKHMQRNIYEMQGEFNIYYAVINYIEGSDRKEGQKNNFSKGEMS